MVPEPDAPVRADRPARRLADVVKKDRPRQRHDGLGSRQPDIGRRGEAPHASHLFHDVMHIPKRFQTVAKRVKVLRPEATVILATGWGMHFDEEKLKSAGVERIITKPFQVDEVLNCINGRR